jgi:hypothetical protein
MEVAEWLKPSISVSRIGDSASVQAATRVNAGQASKRTMRRPTRLPYRGRLKWLRSERRATNRILSGVYGFLSRMFFVRWRHSRSFDRIKGLWNIPRFNSSILTRSPIDSRSTLASRKRR